MINDFSSLEPRYILILSSFCFCERIDDAREELQDLGLEWRYKILFIFGRQFYDAE
jgi:hypothetical protein